MEEDFLTMKNYIIQSVLSLTDTYKKSSRNILVDVANNKEPYLTHIVSILESIFINQKDYKPMVLLNSLRLIKEMMDMKSNNIATKIEKSILPHLLNLARFRSNNKEDDDRGRFLFLSRHNSNQNDSDENKAQYVIGNSFFRLCLECLLIWRLFYPRTQFEYEVDTLLKEGVKFPSDIYYFKKFENYLKNPRDKTNLTGLDLLESNDSPDNLFEGYQSEVDVIKKLEKGLEEFELLKKDFQKNLNFCNGKILTDNQMPKIMEKFQEFGKKSFKMMETVMHSSNLEEKVYHKYMTLFFEIEEFCEEIIEDYKQVNHKIMKEALFDAKYKFSMSSQGPLRRHSSNVSEKFKKQIMAIEKINTKVLTQNELLNLYGKDSNTLKNQIIKSQNKLPENTNKTLNTHNSNKSNHQRLYDSTSIQNEDIKNGKYFMESEEIPMSHREKIEKEAFSSTGGMALKDVQFTESVSNDNEYNHNSHYAYLEKQLSELKKNKIKEKESATLKGKDFIKEKNLIFGEKTINTVNFLHKIENSSLLLEERDQINMLKNENNLKNIKLKNDSGGLPSFGNLISTKLGNSINDDHEFVSNEELLAEKKKLLEKLENLQRDEKEIEQKKKEFTIKESKSQLLMKIHDKNQQILSLKQKLFNHIKINENLQAHDRDPYMMKLQQKYEQLQKDNNLYKQILKTSIQNSPSVNGYGSVNSKLSQKPIKNSIHIRKNSYRSVKIDNRDSVVNGKENNERKSNSPKESDEFFIKDLEITAFFKENIQRLKLCCLKNKGVLFKNQDIQIGILTDLQNYKEKKLLKMYLYFENISVNNIISNIFMKFKANNTINLWVKSQEDCILSLKTHEQNVKELIIDYKTIPFQFALLDFKYQIFDKITRNVIALPNCIIKLIHFQQSEAKEIRNFWLRYKAFSNKTEELSINTDFLENNNFTPIFPHFCEEKDQEKQIEGLEKREFYNKFVILGNEGAIKLKIIIQKNDGKITGVLKLILLENEKGMNHELSEFILNSFKFLLLKVY